MTALFEDIIFGPIHSRRLGVSLGVNLLPQHAKICNFDCIYCECGSNEERRGDAASRHFSPRPEVYNALRTTLLRMHEDGRMPDVITFAGNGEPTLHPQFESIIDDTIALRNELSPDSKISVLSNATTLDNEAIVRALHRVDNSIMKIDSAIESTAALINRPAGNYSVERVIENLIQFGNDAIIQTMLLRGVVDGTSFDNTSEQEVTAWIAVIKRVKPRSVMLYSLDRDTPCKSLERIDKSAMEVIAQQLRAAGIECTVS